MANRVMAKAISVAAKILNGLPIPGGIGALVFVSLPFGAQAAPVRELPLQSDYCAILHALTNRSDPSCPDREIPDATSRSMMGDSQDTRSALSPGEDGFDNGYFVHFAFDSVQLEPAYRAHLDRLAEVLNSPALADTCLKLVGHTDATGPAAYNQDLSVARANAVAGYLSNEVATDRVVIAIAGMGETSPVVGYPPAAAIQRRVEVLSRQLEGQCE